MKILSLVDFVVTEDRARTMVESLRKGGILMKQVTLEELERLLDSLDMPWWWR